MNEQIKAAYEELTQDNRAELWQRYQYEMNSHSGFGSPSRWQDGKPRSYRQFVIEYLENQIPC